jgi:hypothetical protein
MSKGFALFCNLGLGIRCRSIFLKSVAESDKFKLVVSGTILGILIYSPPIFMQSLMY